MAFGETMTRGAPLALRLWLRLQEIVPTAITVDSHFEIFVLFRAKLSEEQTNKRTNEQTFCFGVAMDKFRGSVYRLLRCYAQKEGGGTQN